MMSIEQLLHAPLPLTAVLLHQILEVFHHLIHHDLGFFEREVVQVELSEARAFCQAEQQLERLPLEFRQVGFWAAVGWAWFEGPSRALACGFLEVENGFDFGPDLQELGLEVREVCRVQSRAELQVLVGGVAAEDFDGGAVWLAREWRVDGFLGFVVLGEVAWGKLRYSRESLWCTGSCFRARCRRT